MFHGARTGNTALFGHMPHQDGGDVVSLGQPDHAGGGFLAVPATTRGAVDGCRLDGSHRVDDYTMRLEGFCLASYWAKICSRRMSQVGSECAETFGAD